MKPLFYVDLSVEASTVKHNDGKPAFMPVMGRGFSILHGFFRKAPGSYAVAFPNMREGELSHPGNVIRIFGESRDAVDTLLDNMEQHSFFKGSAYFRVSRVRPVPAGFNGSWVAYARFRVPARNSRKPAEFRMRQLKKAEKLPYFMVSSKSTQQTFSLHVTKQQSASGNTVENETTTDGYGLSTTEKMLYLPDLGLA